MKRRPLRCLLRAERLIVAKARGNANHRSHAVRRPPDAEARKESRLRRFLRGWSQRKGGGWSIGPAKWRLWLPEMPESGTPGLAQFTLVALGGLLLTLLVPHKAALWGLSLIGLVEGMKLVNTGTAAGDPTADPRRTGGTKLNTNMAFTLMAAATLNAGYFAVHPDTGVSLGYTNTQIVQAAINSAGGTLWYGKDYTADVVYVPKKAAGITLLPFPADQVTFNPLAKMLREGQGNLDWFDLLAYGGKDDNTYNNDSAFAAAKAGCGALPMGGVIYVPYGRNPLSGTLSSYKITSTVSITKPVRIVSDFFHDGATGSGPWISGSINGPLLDFDTTGIRQGTGVCGIGLSQTNTGSSASAIRYRDVGAPTVFEKLYITSGNHGIVGISNTFSVTIRDVDVEGSLTAGSVGVLVAGHSHLGTVSAVRFDSGIRIASGYSTMTAIRCEVNNIGLDIGRDISNADSITSGLSVVGGSFEANQTSIYVQHADALLLAGIQSNSTVNAPGGTGLYGIRINQLSRAVFSAVHVFGASCTNGGLHFDGSSGLSLVLSGFVSETATPYVGISGQLGITIDGGDDATFGIGATYAFKAAVYNTFEPTLTGNVTAPTLTNPVPGQLLCFAIRQDSTGGRTFTWPTNVIGGGVVCPASQSLSIQYFKVDVANAFARAVSPMVWYAAGTATGVLNNPPPLLVAFSAAPTFDALKGQGFELGTMTANVTSSTFSNTTPGQILSLWVKQDGTGGRTFAFPASVKGATAIDGTLNHWSEWLFKVGLDGNLYQTSFNSGA